jgi:DNA-binding LytR/AlgR family response regulator
MKMLSFVFDACYNDLERGGMTMQIAICDDDASCRDHLYSILSEYRGSHRLPMDIYKFDNADGLLTSSRQFDLIFLDYQMPGLNGMDTARVLRSRNLTCSIVFITSYPKFVLESFEVQPYRFLLKPVQPQQIYELMTAFVAQHRLLAPLIIQQDGCQITIESKNILYLEASGKNCIIRTLEDTYISSKTLAQVHSLLPQHCFYRTHKSYVVNLYSIRSFDKENVTLINGEVARIGRANQADFRRDYAQFVKDYYVKV